MSFFLLRFFVLLHDCGHGSFFTSNRANKICGYVLGVITGMPQYVWSKHHAYHHTTNGNWEKYQGPLSIISTKAFAALSEKKQKYYSFFRTPLFALPAGCFYVLFNPRFTWIAGSIQVFFNLIGSLVFRSKPGPLKVIKEWKSKYWKTPTEYLHMTYNNVALISLWVIMCNYIGAFNFFIFYAFSLSLSGALGILFFTLQHNFEHSYASDTARTDYYRGALEGSSYLKLPKILNWFTADIAYHHIHHLSTSVPNYRLATCHKDLRDLFTGVKRLYLKDIPKSLKYLLWDIDKQMLVTVSEFQQSKPIRKRRVLTESRPSI